MLVAFFSTVSTLLGDACTLKSPASADSAAVLFPKATADGHWVALYATATAGASTVDPALLAAPASIRNVLNVPDQPLQPDAPRAIGRLRCTESSTPVIDCLQCSLPKEDPESHVQLGLVIDALLLVWAEHVAKTSCSFDDLGASGSFSADEALRTRGFSPSETTDLSALGRGDALITHTMRLADATSAAGQRAADALAGDGASVFDVAHFQLVADTLRGVEDKVSLADPTGRFAPKKDPWAGIKGFGMS